MRHQPPRAGLSLAAFLLAVFAGSAPAAEFKLATVAPENSEWMQELRGASDRIRERTAARVVLKLYGGGVMGNDKKVLRKMRIGQLQGGAFTASGLAERYPDITVYGLPMLFRSRGEVEHVRAALDPVLAAGLEDAGLVSFGFAGGGFANLMSKEPVETLDDLRGQKIWVPEGDETSYLAMAALNLTPTVLPITDVLTGLQTGLLNIVAVPPVGAVVLQWYTKVQYATDLPLTYTMGLLVMDAGAFGKLAPADQVIVREELGEVYARLDAKGWEDNAKAAEALRANGIRYVTPSDEQAASWRASVSGVRESLRQTASMSADLLARLDQLLDEYRAAGPGSAADAAATL